MPQGPRFCPGCGLPGNGTAFCSTCGNNMTGPAEVSPARYVQPTLKITTQLKPLPPCQQPWISSSNSFEITDHGLPVISPAPAPAPEPNAIPPSVPTILPSPVHVIPGQQVTVEPQPTSMPSKSNSISGAVTTPLEKLADLPRAVVCKSCGATGVTVVYHKPSR